MNTLKTIFFVLPCYNEEEVLPSSAEAVRAKLRSWTEAGRVSEDSRVLFVNDRSTDSTWEIIKRLHEQDPVFTGISLAHNEGEHTAYLAGMSEAVKFADAVITMDADLQDDIEATDEMLRFFLEEGKDIVYGVRNDRSSDPLLQRQSSAMFYRMMRRSGTGMVPEHSEFRLMSKRAMEALQKYGERNTFVPCLVTQLGFETAVVYHKRLARTGGKSKYNVKKLCDLATEAVTSFSKEPIRWIGFTALPSSLILLAGIIGLIVMKVKSGIFEPWILIFDSIWAIGTMLLAALRVIGEYVYKTSSETKQRPRYIIEEKTGLNE